MFILKLLKQLTDELKEQFRNFGLSKQKMTPVYFIVHAVLFFCLGSTLSDGLLTQCPDAGQLLPCTCADNPESGVTLQCAYATLKDVKQALAILKDHDIALFSWIDYYGPLFADVFKGMHVSAIWCDRIRTYLVPPGTLLFEELQSTLKILRLNNSQMGFPQIPLNHLSNLEELWIEQIKVNMTTPEAEWVLQWPANLTVLRINKCYIETVEDELFTPLEKLKHLSLANNHITDFNRSSLAYPLDDLISIDLSHNGLIKLDERLFDGMPSLKDVYLTGNQLEFMPWPTWQPVWHQLNIVHLGDNPLDCSSPDLMNWVCTKRLPRHFTAHCKHPIEGLDVGSLEFCSQVDATTKP